MLPMGDNEHTGMFVNSMVRRRKNARLGVVVGVTLSTLFGLFMMLNFGESGQKKMLAKAALTTGAGAGTATPDPAPQAAQTPQAGDSAAAPPAPPAAHAPAAIRVEVSFSHAGQLWVDGRMQGRQMTTTLHLEPGKHTVMYKGADAIMVKSFEAKEGDAYRIVFTDKPTLTTLVP